MRKFNCKFPHIALEMARNGDTNKSLGEIIGLSESQVSCKLHGKYEWTLSEIEKICIYYGKDFYELFKGE